ncbi:MAG: hypothetical protein ACSLEN_14595 [Candidatus Malihini olakiniferum]
MLSNLRAGQEVKLRLNAQGMLRNWRRNR